MLIAGYMVKIEKAKYFGHERMKAMQHAQKSKPEACLTLTLYETRKLLKLN